LGQSADVLNKEAAIFVNHWMDSARYNDVFKSLSEKTALEIDVKRALEQYTPESLADADVYSLIDFKIIHDLKYQILQNTANAEKLKAIIQKRENKFWYFKFEHFYQALNYALELKKLVETIPLHFESLSEGFRNYAESYFQVDLVYRKYGLHAYQAEHVDFLRELSELVEKIYSNTFLLNLNQKWQQLVNQCEKWDFPGIECQSSFFQNQVQPYIEADTRIFVIISDGLRFESAVELNQLLLEKDKY